MHNAALESKSDVCTRIAHALSPWSVVVATILTGAFWPVIST